ncbi:MAG: threonine synthase [Candidatus Brocadiia bacterium]|jgi:threonine synthase|nr:threonine synthase [Candidatus Brocadiia bacterium]
MSEEYRAWLQCFAGCDERYELDEIIYRCRKCDSLLEVRHDTAALARTGPYEWKDLFARRWTEPSGPMASGVWGKREWVCPRVEDANIVSMPEGKTALLKIERFGSRIGVPDLHVKLCGNAHTGSFKDLGMTVLVSMVRQMRAEGKDVPAVACASTGDTSAALAAYCARAGVPCVVFLPHEKISLSQLVQPIASGALTLSLDTDFDGCMKLVQQVCAKNNIYLANSMNSLRVEGQKTVSVEIVQQLGWEVPDWVVIPGGNLGNVSALGLGFEMMLELGLIDRLPRICCAQSANANPLYLSYLKDFESFESVQARETLASAIRIGDPVSVQKAIRTLKTFGGVVEQADEGELADACARVDREEGLFACPHTGVALSALTKLAERGEIGRDDRVVVISTAHGLKFPQFKIDYHASELAGIASRHANPPIELPADYDAVVAAIHDRIETQ